MVINCNLLTFFAFWYFMQEVENTIAFNLWKIPASYKLLTNCTFLMVICFNYLLLCIFITISERNACVMVVFLPPVVLCGIVVAILHVSHRQAIGSPWIYSWIYPWIFPWISTKKSVDMDVDMDGKFHIHGKPEYNSAIYSARTFNRVFMRYNYIHNDADRMLR